MKQTANFLQPYLKKNLPDIRPGDTVKVYQKIEEAPKKGKSSAGQERRGKLQAFEGLVLARKHGKEMGATITVRRLISGIGVEKTFPIHSPTIEKIEVSKRSKTRRAKLYYLREAKGKRARLKKKEFAEVITEEEPPEAEEKPGETEEKKEEEQKPEEQPSEEAKTAEEKNN